MAEADEERQRELLFLVLHALRGGPLGEAAALLQQARRAPRSPRRGGLPRARAAPPLDSARRRLSVWPFCRCGWSPSGRWRRAARRPPWRRRSRRRVGRAAEVRSLTRLASQAAAAHPQVGREQLSTLLSELLRADRARRAAGEAAGSLLGAGRAGVLPLAAPCAPPPAPLLRALVRPARHPPRAR